MSWRKNEQGQLVFDLGPGDPNVQSTVPGTVFQPSQNTQRGAVSPQRLTVNPQRSIRAEQLAAVAARNLAVGKSIYDASRTSLTNYVNTPSTPPLQIGKVNLGGTLFIPPRNKDGSQDKSLQESWARAHGYDFKDILKSAALYEARKRLNLSNSSDWLKEGSQLQGSNTDLGVVADLSVDNNQKEADQKKAEEQINQEVDKIVSRYQKENDNPNVSETQAWDRAFENVDPQIKSELANRAVQADQVYQERQKQYGIDNRGILSRIAHNPLQELSSGVSYLDALANLPFEGNLVHGGISDIQKQLREDPSKSVLNSFGGGELPVLVSRLSGATKLAAQASPTVAKSSFLSKTIPAAATTADVIGGSGESTSAKSTKNFNYAKTPVVDSLEDSSALIRDITPALKDTGASFKQFPAALRAAAGGEGTKPFRILAATIYNPINRSFGQISREVEKTHFDLKSIVGKIKPFGKEDAAIQNFAEKKVSIDDLVKEFGPDKAKKIATASDFFRNQYDQLLIRINQARGVDTKTVPPERWFVQPRKDFMTHVSELSGNKSSEFIQPQDIGNAEVRSYFSKSRTEGAYAPGAIGGYFRYFPQAMREIYLQEPVKRLQIFEQALQESGKTKLAKTVSDRIKLLSGDTTVAPATKAAQFNEFAKGLPGDRAALWADRRIGANMILLNPRPISGQILDAWFKGLAYAPKETAATILRLLTKDGREAIKKTASEGFVQGRRANLTAGYGGRVKRFQDFAAKSIVWADQLGASVLTKALEDRALKAGLGPEAAKLESHLQAALKIGGRTALDMPSIYQGKATNALFRFTYESFNALVDVFRRGAGFDPIYDKNPTMGQLRRMRELATIFVLWHVANKGYEGATGNKFFFDPIQAVVDARDDLEKGKYAEAAGRIVGELGSQAPGGQYVATGLDTLAGEGTSKKIFGGTQLGFGGLGMPLLAPVDLAQGAIKNLKNQPDQSGSILGRFAKDAGSLLIPPAGGLQGRRIFDAGTRLGKPYTTRSGQELSVTPENTPGNFARTLFGGLSATKEVNNYFNQSELGAPITSKQSLDSVNNIFSNYQNALRTGEARGPKISLVGDEPALATKFVDNSGRIKSEETSRKIIDEIKDPEKKLQYATAYEKLRIMQSEIRGSTTEQLKLNQDRNLSEEERFDRQRKIEDQKKYEDISGAAGSKKFLSLSDDTKLAYLHDLQSRGIDPYGYLNEVARVNAEAAAKMVTALDTEAELLKSQDKISTIREQIPYSENTIDFSGLSDDQQRKLYAGNPALADSLRPQADAYQQALINSDLISPYTKANDTYTPGQSIFTGKGFNRKGLSPQSILAGAGIPKSGGSRRGGGRKKKSKKPKKMAIKTSSTAKPKKLSFPKPKKTSSPVLNNLFSQI